MERGCVRSTSRSANGTLKGVEFNPTPREMRSCCGWSCGHSRAPAKLRVSNRGDFKGADKEVTAWPRLRACCRPGSPGAFRRYECAVCRAECLASADHGE